VSECASGCVRVSVRVFVCVRVYARAQLAPLLVGYYTHTTIQLRRKLPGYNRYSDWILLFSTQKHGVR
jgi:hypothetical protein